MKGLHIEPTTKSLEVHLNEGHLVFKGCSINNDPRNFFIPVKNWILHYVEEPLESTVVDMHFEYIDTSSVKYLFEMLKELKVLLKNNYLLTMNWHYDNDDPEILELGEIIQSKLGIEFIFIAV